MIRRISISNYALIRELTVYPAPGFNIITGETGAGKSIILGALSLLQGKRADSKGISVDDEKSSIEAEVIYPDGSAHILRREILPSGRSKALIDGQQVSLAQLTEAAAPLIDIHSQHQNLQLADPAFQLDTLDKLSQNADLIDKYHKAYADYRVALQNFARTRDEIERIGADADYLQYQLKEFDGLDLQPGEDDELEQLRDRLFHSAEIVSNLKNAADVVSISESSAGELLLVASEYLRNASALSDLYAPLVDRLEIIRSELNNLADDIEDEIGAVNTEPENFDEIEAKLRRINTLKTKHRVATVSELIALRDSIASRLDALQNSETTLRNLEQIARRLKKNALEMANELSARRKAAALRLKDELEQRARPLGMENLVVEINISTGKLNPNGIDSVEFLFAFNKNQTPASAANRASGGELSRVMLALKSITVEHQHTPTIIFDEIDTGVSGDVANRMGQLMAVIGKHIQVISITHLPQVAAMGDRHFKVFKRDDEKSTRTFISELEHDERRAELAQMLSGISTDDAALATADLLLKNKK